MSEIIRISPQVKVVKVSTGGGGSGSGVTSYNQLTEVPTTFPPSEHGHTIDEIDSLQTVLDGKAEYVHPHEISDITGLQEIIDGLGGGGGAVSSVAGRTGDVVLTKADVGLSSVDNTSDLSKPVSTATATALAGKSDTSHTHAIGAITGIGTGVSTFLATPSSANLAAALTDETGSNALVFANNSALTGSASIALGTITADAQALSITGAYNNAGVTFLGLLDLNLTANTSNSASLLMNLRLAGTSKMKVGTDGVVYASSIGNKPTFAFLGNTSSGMEDDTFNNVYIRAAGTRAMRFGWDGQVQISSGSAYTFSSTSIGGATDLLLYRGGPNIHAWRNGTNAQEGRIYNRYDGTNDEWLSIQAVTGNPYKIQSRQTGTGTMRPIEIDAGSYMNFNLSGANKLGVGGSFNISYTPFVLPSYTVAGVPSAAALAAGTILYISNESGGAVLAFNDGTNWRRVTDRAIIS